MVSDIETMPLEALCEEVVDCPHSTPVWTDQGVVVLRSPNIKNGRLDLSNPSFTDEFHYEERSRRARIRGGDVVITREAPMGEVCLIPDDLKCCLGQRMVLLRPSLDVCSGKYLLYALQSRQVQNEIKSHDGTGSTVSNLRIPVLKNLSIPTPSLDNQKVVAHILGTLDDKIELNRRSTETLEDIAKALFKSWFVDFDPVRAKAEGRPTGLPDEISELFPDSFEESELGEIPGGWRSGDLNDLADLNPESWSAKNHPSELIYVDLSGTKNGKIEETVVYEWSDAPSRARRVLKEGDTIVGTVRPGNRSFSLIQRVGLTGSTGFAVIRPKQLFNASFLYVASTSDESIDRLAHLADGGAYPAVRPDVVMETPINIPSEPVQMLFGELTDSLFRKISANEQESVVLGQLRDALLPRLISGELRVPDAEKMLEEVGV